MAFVFVVYSLGYNYFVAFINEYSRMTWVYLLKSQDKVFEIFSQNDINPIFSTY